MFQWLPVVSLALSVVLSAVGAWTDFRTGHIPNWLTLSGIVAGFAIQTLAGYGHVNLVGYGGLTAMRGLGAALVGTLVCALVPMVMFYKEIARKDGTTQHVSGGGDLKLFAAQGALLGYFHGVELQFFAFCAAGVFGMARLAWHGRLLQSLTNTLFILFNPVLPKRWRREITAELLTPMRIGGAILAGTVMSVLARQPF